MIRKKLRVKANTVKANSRLLQTIFNVPTSKIVTVYRENFAPCFIFAIFAKWPKGEFKTEQIELYVMDYVGKLESGQIQEVVNRLGFV